MKQENTPSTSTNNPLLALAEPFAAEDVVIRAGTPNADRTSAVALPSVDARVVQQRLDDILGPQNWKAEFREVVAGQKVSMVVCQLSVRVASENASGAYEWVTKEDAAHVSEAVNVVSEFAVKGAYGDAFKRAAVMWGVGRYLYRLPRVRVALDGAGHPVLTPALVQEILGHTQGADGQALRTATSAPAPALAGAPLVEARKTAAAVGEPTLEAAPVVEVAQATEKKAVQVDHGADSDAKASAEDPPAAQLSTQELERVQVQAEVLGQPLPPSASKTTKPEKAATPSPASARAPAPAAAEASQTAGAPAGLTAEESKLVAELEARVKKLPTTMMRSYLDGPKAKSSLSEASRQHLLRLVQAKEAKA